MPERRRRSLTAEFKAQVVLGVLSGLKGQSWVEKSADNEAGPRLLGLLDRA